MRYLRLFLLLPILAMTTLPGCDRGAHPGQTGKVAPDFDVSDGFTSVKLSNYRGKVVLLNFWATWCGPCVAEMPSLLQFQRDNPNVTVIAVSIDEDPGAYARFLKQRHVDLITVRDPNQTAANLFHTDMWPETYAIDRQGVIRRKFVGATDWSDPEIRSYIQRL